MRENGVNEIYPVSESHRRGRCLAVPDAGNVCSEEHFTNSETSLVSRFHGLINFFVIMYTKEVYGFVDSWDAARPCERTLPSALVRALQPGRPRPPLEHSAAGPSGTNTPRWDSTCTYSGNSS